MRAWPLHTEVGHCCVHLLQEDVNVEELKTEIAGLEGLMKDLSAVTQRQMDT